MRPVVAVFVLLLSDDRLSARARGLPARSTNVWDAQYPRVDGAGARGDPDQGAGRHEGPAQLLERARRSTW